MWTLVIDGVTFSPTSVTLNLRVSQKLFLQSHSNSDKSFSDRFPFGYRWKQKVIPIIHIIPFFTYAKNLSAVFMVRKKNVFINHRDTLKGLLLIIFFLFAGPHDNWDVENNPKMKAMLKFKFWPRFSVVLSFSGRHCRLQNMQIVLQIVCSRRKKEKKKRVLKNVTRIQIWIRNGERFLYQAKRKENWYTGSKVIVQKVYIVSLVTEARR